MSNVLNIETWGEISPPTVSVRIKRQSDGLFYDVANATFNKETNCTNPFLPLTSSASVNSPNSVQASVTLSAQFTDGDYTIYWHDLTVTPSKMYDISEVSIFGGSAMTQSVPNVTSIAGRIMECTIASHTNPGTVGAWMTDLTARLQKIQTKLGV